MPRANRHFLPGLTWHLTHRCHKREFLLKFARDRRRWIHWLYEARKRYGVTVLNYMVTSNRETALPSAARTTCERSNSSWASGAKAAKWPPAASNSSSGRPQRLTRAVPTLKTAFQGPKTPVSGM